MINREVANETQTGVFALDLPKPTFDHVYLSAKLISWNKPNSKGAEFSSDEIDQAVLDAWVGRQVNIEHDKTKVIGNIRKLVKTKLGVESVIEVDRSQAEAHGLAVSELGETIFGTSCEFTREPAKSSWILRSSDGTIAKRLTAVDAEALGLRRTTKFDPFKYQGMCCSELCRVEAFTGVGLTKSPADTSAQIFRVAASDHALIEACSNPTEAFPVNMIGFFGGFAGGKPIKNAQPHPQMNPSLNRRPSMTDEKIAEL